jgi:acetyl-CoA carboxylase biotin carboxyl carrier protein
MGFSGSQNIADGFTLPEDACCGDAPGAPWCEFAESAGVGRAMNRTAQVNGTEKPMATDVEAQIAGSLWKIEKAPGDSVREADVIMIIESMKMEIPVESPCDGTIAEICVSEGDSIEEGTVLAVIE